jgi:glyoxylase-like metal-dependent hydrolase (beta-lactamase superfamily II)
VRQIAGRVVTHVVLTHKHFDHVLGSGVFTNAEIYCAPQVFDYLTTATGQLRDDALRYGADADEVDRAIAALRPPQHAVNNAVVDLGNRQMAIAHLGRGHTGADLVVVVPGDDGEQLVVFSGDLIEESGDPAIDADSDLAAWPDTLDRLLAVGGPDAAYVPGHGSVVDAEFVHRQQDWLRWHHRKR